MLSLSWLGSERAVDLHKAVMSNICVALRRPLREPHPEKATALAAEADLLATGVADEYARVMIEYEASKLYEANPWEADKRATEIVRPAPVQAADNVPPKSLARDMAFAKLQSRILAAAEAVQAAKRFRLLDGHAQVTDRTGTECAMEDGHGAVAWCNARCRGI